MRTTALKSCPTVESVRRLSTYLTLSRTVLIRLIGKRGQMACQVRRIIYLDTVCVKDCGLHSGKIDAIIFCMFYCLTWFFTCRKLEKIKTWRLKKQLGLKLGLSHRACVMHGMHMQVGVGVCLQGTQCFAHCV